MQLFQNIINNFTSLRDDITGFNISFAGIGQFFLHIIIATSIFVIFYLLGEKIRKLFFNENKKYNFFVSIGIGYIVVGTGIGILGVFSLLETKIISAYLIIIILIALYKSPFALFKKINSKIFSEIIKKGLSNNLAIWGVLLFILIALLRLPVPDTGEDGYHTDLPKLYLTSHTSIHETKELLHVIPYPQLAEMIYLIPIFFGEKEAAKYIHFGFYILVVSLLFTIATKREYSYARYAPLLFVTAPLVVRYSVFQYTDFFMLFAFLLSVILLEKNQKSKTVILSGIIYGAVLSVKMWMLIYLPAILVYVVILNKDTKIKHILKITILFIIFALLVPLLWYVRAYIITGNPIYPIFTNIEYLETKTNTTPTSAFGYFGFNKLMFTYPNLIVLSPLLFLGIFFTLLNYKEIIRRIGKSSLAVFFIILTFEQLFIQVYLGRYLLAWYAISCIVISTGVLAMLDKSKTARLTFTSIYFLIFFYTFLTTILVLPYGLGWADKNAYLTRVLYRDNASYYDFDRLFNKWISDKDLVATDGIVGFYYADFNYIDIGFIFSKDKRSFDLLKEKNVTRLLVKGGDIEWFCNRLSLTGCSKEKVKLLATYPPEVKKYNLYSIQK